MSSAKDSKRKCRLFAASQPGCALSITNIGLHKRAVPTPLADWENRPGPLENPRVGLALIFLPCLCVLAKRLRDVCGLPESEPLWRAGRGFVVRDLPWTWRSCASSKSQTRGFLAGPRIFPASLAGVDHAIIFEDASRNTARGKSRKPPPFCVGSSDQQPRSKAKSASSPANVT